MKMKAERKKIGWVLLAGLACGAIVWALSVPLTGMREPWDSPGYYYIVAVFIAGILAALPAPRYWWAAVVGGKLWRSECSVTGLVIPAAAAASWKRRLNCVNRLYVQALMDCLDARTLRRPLGLRYRCCARTW